MTRLSKEQKNYNIVWETYELLYKAATPSADFNELVKNSKYEDIHGKLLDIPAGTLTDEDLRQKGYRRFIPYDDYSLDAKTYDAILESQIKKYKLKKMEAEGLRNNINLGCSPNKI